MARFWRRFAFVSVAYTSCVRRGTQSLGLKVGADASAITAPSRGSSTTPAPVRPSSCASSTACTSLSIVSCRSSPGDGATSASRSFSIIASRCFVGRNPRASTRTLRSPETPVRNRL